MEIIEGIIYPNYSECKENLKFEPLSKHFVPVAMIMFLSTNEEEAFLNISSQERVIGLTWNLLKLIKYNILYKINKGAFTLSDRSYGNKENSTFAVFIATN